MDAGLPVELWHSILVDHLCGNLYGASYELLTIVCARRVCWTWYHLLHKSRAECANRAIRRKWVLSKSERANWIPTEDMQVALCRVAAKKGHLEVLRWLRSQNPPYAWDYLVWGAAAASGKVDVLEWLRRQDPPCPWDDNWVLGKAAGAGSIEIMEWLCAYLKDRFSSSLTWPRVAYIRAAENGHLHVLRWLRSRERYPDWDSGVCDAAISSGNIEPISWLRSQDPPCPWGYYISFDSPAARGDIAMIKWMMDNGAPCRLTKELTQLAAMRGKLDMLKWLRGMNPPCPWNEQVCEQAAYFGHLDVLKWGRSQTPPAPWNASVCAAAARGGHLGVLQWLRTQNPPCPIDVYQAYARAVDNQNLDIIGWLLLKERDPNFPEMFDEMVRITIERGTLEMLELLVNAGSSMRMNKENIIWEVRYCHDPGMLQWIYSRYQDWFDVAFTNEYLVHRGSKKLLQRFRSLHPPCPWDESTALEAAIRGRAGMLAWMRRQDPPCPWNESLCMEVLAHKGKREKFEAAK